MIFHLFVEDMEITINLGPTLPYPLSMPSEISLSSLMSDFTPDQETAFKLLLECDQSHLFAQWSEGESEAQAKASFFEQVNALNTQYPGGLKKYCKNAKRLLEASKVGANPYEGYTPNIPEGQVLTPGGADHRKMETLGLQNVEKMGFVLVAGGLGERLGYSGIKIALPLETLTGQSFIQHYIETILAFQSRARHETGRSGLTLPLAIMTSGDTHDLTLSFLQENSYFGMKESQVTIMKQEKVPSLINNQAHFAQPAGDPYTIETKPHGHGDVHVLLHGTGTARRWKEDLGIEYIVFFQDTNGLVFNAVLPALGVSIDKGFEMNSITVPRRAGEAAGGIVRLEKTSGEHLTINVEYNQLDPLLRDTVNSDGDVPDETGFSPYPGNINVLLFALEPYIRNLEASGGMIPEFVNPKYADESKESFKKTTRLECMMQDYPLLLKSGGKVGFTTLPREWCFSAVKNNIVDAAKKSEAGLPPESGASGEMDVYSNYRQKLKLAGSEIEEAEPIDFSGVKVCPGPKVILSPDYALTLDELNEKVKNLKITASSTLILRNSGTIDELELDGRLQINSKADISDMKIQNSGDRLVPSTQSDDEKISIRGFTIEIQEEKIL